MRDVVVLEGEGKERVPAWVYVCVMDPVAEGAVEIPEESWAAYMARTAEVQYLICVCLRASACVCASALDQHRLLSCRRRTPQMTGV